MATKGTDFRIVEMKLLQNVGGNIWPAVSFEASGNQAHVLGITPELYADIVLTMVEDGYLFTPSYRILHGVTPFARSKDQADRQFVLRELLHNADECHPMTATYRGLRRIEELREQLRRDRILEKFGILLDGRYIVSDLIDFLEKTKGSSLSLLLADVDDFKVFNTNHGYQGGDAVLRQVFRLFQQMIGVRGEVYRRGGEEILALLPFCELQGSKELAERICETVSQTEVSHDGKKLRVTVSIGVTASLPHDPDGPALEVHAENGLREAKKAGKDRVVVA
jgi:diguanylate cyclase (GGDEF)-like protein